MHDLVEDGRVNNKITVTVRLPLSHEWVDSKSLNSNLTGCFFFYFSHCQRCRPPPASKDLSDKAIKGCAACIGSTQLRESKCFRNNECAALQIHQQQELMYGKECSSIQPPRGLCS